ncbi:g patch domain-containing protein 3 [Caerostris extrusa]|uniref:G patch domain-containing protein 3 n=1 Tax=Caerostris extrusa TaxID=172846 RepID=A0AAV4XY56_CAEEX|nr:g patch domain-containing protein 3 [Caerostris extrusa]
MQHSVQQRNGVYVIVNNIPKEFHSSHLRNFFSSFIETGGFVCFHFRHRPEIQKPSHLIDKSDSEKSRQVSNCCVIKVVPDRVDEFIKTYNGEHWLDNKGETLSTCCFLKRINLSKEDDSYHSGSTSFKKGTISTNLPLDREEFSNQDVESLIEMHPPSFMPNGNIGTKTNHFLNEIRACRLPPSLISKLGLQFPRNRSRRIYGSVGFDYRPKREQLRSKNKIFAIPDFEPTFHKKPWCSRLPVEDLEQDNKEDKEESESEEEEWDRHESLHDDVTGQERNKERLFEEKIELKWEKGGSGLVFYTDAQYWDAKEGDFDAKTSDDWDIDTRIYEQPGVDNDKDMKDLIRMKLEEKNRTGTETERDRLYDFAAFEKYSKGIGRKLLEAHGWKQGQGVGRNAAGIAEPLPNEGQRPFDKKGFGYRGEKLNRRPAREKRKRKYRDSETLEDDFFISTIYDDPKVSDPPESVFASSSFARLKYRQEFLKECS